MCADTIPLGMDVSAVVVGFVHLILIMVLYKFYSVCAWHFEYVGKLSINNVLSRVSGLGFFVFVFHN